MSKIITIGREFGSGGRELGRRLAERLGYQYYDKEIITEIAKKIKASEGYVDQVLEQRPMYLFPITIGHSIDIGYSYTIRQYQTVYEAQSEIITDLAKKSNCVIVGRCADYILRNEKPFKIFVHADMESRVARCQSRKTEDENYTDKEMRKRIKSIDKNRSKYYNFYTYQTWGDKSNYDLCINTTNANIKEMVEVIAKLFE